jgi:hypothetical protein
MQVHSKAVDRIIEPPHLHPQRIVLLEALGAYPSSSIAEVLLLLFESSFVRHFVRAS